jgi:hypothetical protein
MALVSVKKRQQENSSRTKFLWPEEQAKAGKLAMLIPALCISSF